MKTIIGIVIGIALVLAFQKLITEGEKSPPPAPTSEATSASEIPDSTAQEFANFYKKFHADSLFQLEHITFPLEGLPTNADDATKAAGDFRWQKETWKLHKPFKATDGTYERKLFPISDMLIEEIIHFKYANQISRRRFYKSGNGWNLIYYAAPNDLPNQK